MAYEIGDRVRFHWRSVLIDHSVKGRGPIVMVYPSERTPILYKVASDDHDGSRFYLTESDILGRD